MKTEPRIGQYKLLQLISRDLTSEVWKASDTVERPVLLKLYRTNLPEDTTSLTYYVHEVERVASLRHPNLVRIHDVQVLASHNPDSPPSLIYVVTEYIEGESLADYIEHTSAVGKMPHPAEIVQLFSTIALAIESAHQHGIIHGNLKPTNILLKPDEQSRIGTPVLTDFGPTRVLPQKHSNNIPFYLAPEQIQGAPADKRSDVYALGAILYEIYTGGPPFRANRPIAVMLQHVNALPTSPDLVNPSISPALAQVILRSLAKDPQERFPTATSLAVALAKALHQVIPEELRRSVVLQHEATVPVASPDTYAAPQSTRSTFQKLSKAPKQKRRNASLVILAMVALTLLLVVSFGSLLLSTQGNAIMPAQKSGHVFFVNSGQLDKNSNQGINDELEIELSNLPNPAPGKSYYAWLLADIGQSETAPIFLGRLTVEHGNVHFLYPGDKQHANLLGFASRFLINEDDAHTPSSDPLLDQSTWRYYAAIPQTPDPADKLHFSMLDHLRHLLVESPELKIRGLHGGLAFWFVKDTATISNLANSLADDWQKKDADAIHQQLIRILDYLDSTSFVNNDVPPGTPMLADAQIAQMALLGPAPQDADPPGYVYQNEAPPGYIYLIQTHMNGALLSPQSTLEQHQLATQINGSIDSIKRLLTQIHQDAKQLANLTDAQLLQPSNLTLLDDLATQAQYAYTGQPNPSAGVSQGGAIWIYDNLQRLASFTVAPYTAPK